MCFGVVDPNTRRDELNCVLNPFPLQFSSIVCTGILRECVGCDCVRVFVSVSGIAETARSANHVYAEA